MTSSMGEIYAEGRANGRSLGAIVVPGHSTGILAALAGLCMVLRRRHR
ncbi:MAG: hypothetical protein VCA55_13430 [Verrucomicrobiales bacterium]